MTRKVAVRHADQRAISNTDDAEIEAILNGFAVPDAGTTDDRISGEMDDLEVGTGADALPWTTQDLQVDAEVGDIRTEVNRRISLIGDAYPFRLTKGRIEHIPSNTGIYEYCLGIARTNNSISTSPYTSLPRSFERLVPLIIQKHLGPTWEYLHTGTPRDEGQPTFCHEMLHNVGDVSSDGREWRYDPSEDYEDQDRNFGDNGLDFVIWRRSSDSRIGQPYYIGQCACGNDWDTKFRDLMEEDLKNILRPLSKVPPVRCFATPFVLSDGNFLLAHDQAGWTFDRLRLAKIAFELAADPEVSSKKADLTKLFELAITAD